jgi:hypothetical protein
LLSLLPAPPAALISVTGVPAGEVSAQGQAHDVVSVHELMGDGGARTDARRPVRARVAC